MDNYALALCLVGAVGFVLGMAAIVLVSSVSAIAQRLTDDRDEP